MAFGIIYMRILKNSAWLQAFAFSGVLLCSTVYADEHNAYVQLNAGASFIPSTRLILESLDSIGYSLYQLPFKYDPGFAASVALGCRLSNSFRLEGEVMYQSNDFNNGQIMVVTSNGTHLWDGAGERRRTAFLLNAYYDFKNSTPFTPFVTAGLGGYHAQLQYHNSNVENDVDFAYQVGAGVNYKVNDTFSVDLKYRYFAGVDGNAQFAKELLPVTAKVFEVSDHQVMAGLRIGF